MVAEGVSVGDVDEVMHAVGVSEGVIEGDAPAERDEVGVAVSDGVTVGDTEDVSVPVSDCTSSAGVDDAEAAAAAVAVAVKPAGLADAEGTTKGDGCGRPAAARLPSKHEQPTVRLRSGAE